MYKRQAETGNKYGLGTAKLATFRVTIERVVGKGQAISGTIRRGSGIAGPAGVQVSCLPSVKLIGQIGICRVLILVRDKLVTLVETNLPQPGFPNF